MRRAAVRSITTGLALMGLIGSACGKTTGPGGGNTNWLMECGSDDDCTGETRCLCGMCSIDCTDDDACMSVSSGAVCVESATCEDRACGVECAIASDCRSLGPDARCVDSVCRIPASSGGLGGRSTIDGTGGMPASGAGGISQETGGRLPTGGSGLAGDPPAGGASGATADDPCSVVSVVFTKPDYADPTLSENQDCLTPDVCITRGDDGSLYNAAVVSESPGGCQSTEPSRTSWVRGACAEVGLHTSNFGYFMGDFTGCDPSSVVGERGCLLLYDQGMEFDFTLLEWSKPGSGGGFSYVRSSVPCGAPGATCTSAGDWFTCSCPAGFVGYPGGAYGGRCYSLQ